MERVFQFCQQLLQKKRTGYLYVVDNVMIQLVVDGSFLFFVCVCCKHVTWPLYAAGIVFQSSFFPSQSENQVSENPWDLRSIW